jgi:hypothetical protein
VHWLAYASWPVALLHSFGTGSDPKASWLVALGLGSVIAVAAATLVRIGVGGGLAAARVAGAVASVAAPVALGLWYLSGPAQQGWAARAGTPQHLIASKRAVRPVRILTNATAPPKSFRAQARGTIRQTAVANGVTSVVVRLRLAGGPGGALRIDLRGTPVDNGVAMSASGVSFVPATTRTVYLGAVTGLQGNLVAATVRDAAGDQLQLTIELSLDAQTGTAGAVIAAVTPGSGGAG